jgi:hypothetical protein
MNHLPSRSLSPNGKRKMSTSMKIGSADLKIQKFEATMSPK